ncbi:5-oxoprolinase subunit B family protein [Amycolatopsis saalfeldensis]|uniref:Sensor histidine kinase inhibitor, KipI family n=1 Tax=Amycolatopsis saalfeldensis TaxID=394193 RepID=A0A1H8WPI4_9PSEU|nr:allophanate hydrolase subunit 1 [Amycolatopsis saalfeldensis]SEP28988.1 sensor histidine kinase inhibitor, KipI family [Amycolatopsis saalfeldensis]
MTEVLRYGGSAALVETSDVLGFQAALELSPLVGVVELVPAAQTLLVRYDPSATSWDTLASSLRSVSSVDSSVASPATVTLPVRYDGSDLNLVAAASSLTAAEVVQRHSSVTYVAAFCGFAPGFAYLTGLDPALHLPRRPTPRTRVPSGAIAIAGAYTAVYPHPSPGGWHLLGHTMTPVWDTDRGQPNLLVPGTRVRFEVLQ